MTDRLEGFVGNYLEVSEKEEDIWIHLSSTKN